MRRRYYLERPAHREHLRALVAVAVDAADAAGADEDVRHAVRLATEEVCTNIIMHGYGEAGDGRIRVEADFDDYEIVIRISDDAPLLDLESVAAPDTGASAEERPIGGLGWYFVRSVMDGVVQAGTGEPGNIFMLTKRYRRALDSRT
jgi:anti-sigma regulatory factor (Ser/Thr protein kinase)